VALLGFTGVFVTASVFSFDNTATEAPAAFDGETNGAVTPGAFTAAQMQFDQVEGLTDGLGPVYNAQSCRECHQSIADGGASQVREVRAGHRDAAGHFVGALVPIGDGSVVIGPRSLINQRAICAEAAEQLPASENIRTLRMSLNTLGDGFVEAVPDQELIEIAEKQRLDSAGKIHGQIIYVDVLEAAPGTKRVGRFGWKDQHASLLSFSADAYLNEMGVTNRLQPDEVTLLCNGSVQEPNSQGNPPQDIDQFATFMRATKAPPRDLVRKATLAAQQGSDVFDDIGCASCHVRTLVTAPAGTKLNGGIFTLPDALGNKIFHPFSDFLLHDVGTGDGIVQNGGQETANKLRTPPLWGVRTHPELMHDGRSLNFADAILRHGGEATQVIENFRGLSEAQKHQLIAFLKSL
jgi:CxxC motif-containing protein (DUF1111 family)